MVGIESSISSSFTIYLSRRTDSQFWIDNRDNKTVPQSLLEKLTLWRQQLPTDSDFFSKYEVFRLENYQYVLYGMDFKTELNSVKKRYFKQDQVNKFYQRMSKLEPNLVASLPKHRDLIEQLNTHGMKAI